MPREESFPIPLKYVDVTRNTHTSLDVKQDVDDYWNVDGDRELSDTWTGFNTHNMGRKTSRWIYVVWEETVKKTNDFKTRKTVAGNVETHVRCIQT